MPTKSSTNGNGDALALGSAVRYEVTGVSKSRILYHRRMDPPEEVKWAEKCKKEGKDPKKTDNVAAFVYRCPETGNIIIPAKWLKGAMCQAVKGEKVEGKGNLGWPGKVKPGIAVTPECIEYTPGKKSRDGVFGEWVTVNGKQVWRDRPFVAPGTEFKFVVEVTETEDISEEVLMWILKRASLFGIGDNRPGKSGGSFGRIRFTSLARIDEEEEDELVVVDKRKKKNGKRKKKRNGKVSTGIAVG